MTASGQLNALRNRLAECHEQRRQLREELSASERWRHDVTLEREYYRQQVIAVRALADASENSTFHDRAVRDWWVREIRLALAAGSGAGSTQDGDET